MRSFVWPQAELMKTRQAWFCYRHTQPTDLLCLIQTPLYVHTTNMRSAVGYEPACGLSRNLWDIKEQFLLCAAELTPQNTRPHGTDAVQTRPPQWKVGPPLRENTSTFLLPRVPASAINYKTTVRETVWSLSLPSEAPCCLFPGGSAALWLDVLLLHTDPLFMKSHVMKFKGLACYKTMLIICRVK